MLGEEDVDHVEQHHAEHHNSKVMPMPALGQASSSEAAAEAEEAEGNALAAAAAAATVAAAEDDDDFEKAKQEVGRSVGRCGQAGETINGFSPHRLSGYIACASYI